jgi:hypothetical protein
MYDETGFPDDETSIGYMIHVFQDSINKTFPEYLVNFDYLVQMLSNYGFSLLKKEEAISIGMPNGSGLFSELFAEMETELKQNPRKEPDYKRSPYMSTDEKWISFMNRYFVFKKTHNVDAERIYKQFVSKKMLSDLEKQTEEYEDELELANKVAKEAIKETKKPKIRKLTKKMVIDKYSPVLESSDGELPPKNLEKIADEINAAILPPVEAPATYKEIELIQPPVVVEPAIQKPKITIGRAVSIKAPKPKITIGETVKIVKKVKKSDT